MKFDVEGNVYIGNKLSKCSNDTYSSNSNIAYGHFRLRATPCLLMESEQIDNFRDTYAVCVLEIDLELWIFDTGYIMT